MNDNDSKPVQPRSWLRSALDRIGCIPKSARLHVLGLLIAAMMWVLLWICVWVSAGKDSDDRKQVQAIESGTNKDGSGGLFTYTTNISKLNTNQVATNSAPDDTNIFKLVPEGSASVWRRVKTDWEWAGEGVNFRLGGNEIGFREDGVVVWRKADIK